MVENYGIFMFQLPKGYYSKSIILADESTSRLDRKQVSLWKQRLMIFWGLHQQKSGNTHRNAALSLHTTFLSS